MERPFSLYLLFVLHLFLGIGAVYGGGMLLIKPDGSGLGMDTEWLSHSPFNTYLIPAFILFTLIGLFPLLTFVGLLTKPDWKWANTLNLYANRHWAWTFSLYSGIIVITWITVQLIMTQYFWLQSIMIFTGLFIIIFTLTPAVMKNFETSITE
ncbi:hypothetical protein [Cyclobacterium jeungdonense]|uniref:Uncharacterized protein n=1 Tax=Cyclobacterium jeungdonense TaxID=708087 RepID=A0ABT8C2P2_9BACT|nr:hypothetical protein [Cyclobacterium jeungdonense]MDN3686996.1 hypothetical protein [Cyclobacterium jeungdonense]